MQPTSKALSLLALPLSFIMFPISPPNLMYPMQSPHSISSFPTTLPSITKKRPSCLRIPTLLIFSIVPLIIIILHPSFLPPTFYFQHRGSLPFRYKPRAESTVGSTPAFFSPRRLSNLSVFSDHYQAPKTNASTSYTLSSLRSILALADENPPKFRPNLKIKHGFTVDSVQATTGYTLLKSPVNPFCPASLSRIARNPPTNPFCLSVISNGFIGLHGVVLQPHMETIYDLAGGCCSDVDWKRHLNSNITLTDSHLSTMRPGRIVLNLGQHHGSTYHHVIHEIMPRYLSLVPLIEETELIVLVDDSTVSPFLLCEMLGLPPERLKIQPFRDQQDQWFYASVILVPPPIYKQQHRNIFPGGIVHTTASLLRDVAAMKSKLSISGSKQRIVLIERALRRKPDGSCQEKRCIKNFEELKRGLEIKFGHTHDLFTYKADATVDTAVRMFSSADVVVGFHGAGFQNLMFCREGVTVVHIGYESQYKDLADECKLRYHLSKASGTSWGMKSIILDVNKVLRDVERAVKEDRAWEGRKRI